MSMGQAKIEKVIDENGQERTSRIPQKPLSKAVKGALMLTLKRDDITIEDKPDWGRVVTTVKDAKGAMLFLYHSAWDYGYYFIQVANPDPKKEPIMAAEMDWFERDNYTNPQQQDIFDVANRLEERQRELAAKSAVKEQIVAEKETLTADDNSALATLGFAAEVSQNIR